MDFGSNSKYERPYFYTRPPPTPPPPPATVNPQSKDPVSPSVLLIIIILAIIFFIAGLVHLLVRYLMRPLTIHNRDYPDDQFDNVTALQGQLQQLFHLHDSGVDQSFIDSLPVFTYKSIIGVRKDPFDCAVCLCEFECEDKLRLLPKCSHAFHMDCIDTWLLSHSTCPLCRATLLSHDFITPNNSPIVLVLESRSSHHEISREIVNCDSSSMSNEEFEFDNCEKKLKEDENNNNEKVVTIKLGKFKNVDGIGVIGEGSSSSSSENGKQITIDSNSNNRRCFSMGSFEYVMDENSSLKVPIRTQGIKKQASKKSSLPITASHRPAMSECDGDLRRDFDVLGKSFSKIWLRGKKDRKPNNSTVASSRGSFSFRFAVDRNELKANRRANSEVNIGRWQSGDDDQEFQSCHWLDDLPTETPSFARKTLLWLMGRQQIKVVHSSCTTNV